MNRFRAFIPCIVALLATSGAHAQTVIGGGKNVPAFPINITQSGSYKLAANLNVPAGSDGIVIASGLNVTLDLGGNQLLGTIVCSKGGCNSSVQTTGIKVGESTVRIHGGSVRGFLVGIGMNTSSPLGRVTLEDIVVSANFNGIYLNFVQATRVLADNNAAWGFYSTRGVIVESMALRNGHIGIGMDFGVVRSSTSTDNGKYGFEIGGGMYDGLAAGNNAAGNSVGGSAGVNALY